MTTPLPPTVQIGRFTVNRHVVVWTARIILLALLVWIVYIAPPTRTWPMWLAAAGWMAFSIYWELAARTAGTTKKSESAASRRVHVILTNAGLLLLFIPVPGLGHTFLPSSPAWIPLGLAVEAAGLAFAIWSRRHLGANWSGRIEIKEDHALIRSGPYRLLRHPIYTGILAMYIGTALVDGKVHALLGVAMVMFAYWRKIRMEEANMRDAFGTQYDDYRRATWALVPGLY
jgi:protein-S-isoprenylcysteine O-methyltransferase Ste14